MRKISTRSEYSDIFKGKEKEALERAIENRKFEIELYWKRATYFWTIIGAAFAGYFALQRLSPPSTFEGLFIVSSLGLVVSVSWYLVNRGSKFWQNNWEQQVQLLEDEVIGPLHKTVVSYGSCDLWKPLDAFTFSVTKVNHALSLFIIASWVFLAYKSCSFAKWPEDQTTLIIVSLSTFVFMVVLLISARTTSSERDIEVDLCSREYHR